MPLYAYKAKEGPVRTVEGRIEADTKAQAVALIDRQGLSPVWIREAEATPDVRTTPRRRRARFRDVTMFTYQLAGMLGAGVSILNALRTVAAQSECAGIARMADEVAARIRDGGMLSDGLAAHGRLFPPLYLNLVRAGEEGGVLAEVLSRIADERDKEEELRRKVQASLAYPALILVVGAATLFVLLAFFMPRIVVLFRDRGNLPLPTRLLMALTGLFSANWHWFLLVALLGAAVLHRLAALERGARFFDRLFLRLPLLGHFVLIADVARFSRTLGVLLESGISIDRALMLTGNALKNAVLREQVERVRHETVTQGAPLSEGLRRLARFPPMLSNMVAVGEESGRLDRTLLDVASYYERELDQRSRMAVSLIEPIMILVIGGLVGFIVFAMLLPIFQISAGV